MKKISYLVKIFVVIAAAGIVTSCLKADNSFGFTTGGGYIVQEYIDDTPRFYTYISFSVRNGDLASGSVTKDDETFSGNQTVENYYEIAPSYKSSLSDVNGSYTLKATSTEGESATATLNFGVDNSRKLGQMEVRDMSYSGGYLTLKVKSVSNAVGYGFILRPYISSSVPEYSRIYDNIVALYTSNAYEQGSGITYDDGIYTIKIQFDSSTDMGESPYATIYPIAVSTSNNGNIILNGPGKVVYNGSTSM